MARALLVAASAASVRCNRRHKTERFPMPEAELTYPARMTRAIVLACFGMTLCLSRAHGAGSFDVNAPYAILMDSATGAVLFEKAADTQTAPASYYGLFYALVQE